MTRTCRLVALAALAAPVPALAQAVVNPNQVVGGASFTNVNPEIRALLAAVGPGGYSWSPRADSLDAPVLLTAVTWVGSPTRESVAYELTVESSATGIRYDTSIDVQSAGGIVGYAFKSVESPPVLLEPEPDVRVDFAECAALLRLSFVDDTGAGCPIASATASAHRTGDGRLAWTSFPAGATGGDLLLRGDGLPTDVTVTWTIGADPFSNEISFSKEYTVSPACDEILELTCSGSSHGSDCPLARIVGRFDVVGEEEIPRGHSASWANTLVKAHRGPFGNRRYDGLWTEPACGPFELENLVPSVVTEPPTPYEVEITYEFGRGSRYHRTRSPKMRVTVGCGEVVDLGDAFVMTPSAVVGPIVLAGPPEGPPVGSVFDHLRRITDPINDVDGDGIPDDPNEISDTSCVHAQWSGGVSAGITIPLDVYSAFAGDVQPGGAFVGSQEVVLSAPSPDPSRYDVGELTLVFSTPQDTPPEAMLSARVVVDDHSLRETWLAPGESLFASREVCFGLVRLGFVATAGQFYRPYASERSYQPPERDFLGRRPARSVGVGAGGSPRTEFDASDTGLVLLPLPEGRYVLRPKVVALNPSGGVSTVQVLDVGVKAGCRQVLDVLPELVVELDDLAPCAEDGLVPISGRVHSSEVVARAWATVEGVGETTLCEPCGVSPELSAIVALGATDHVVTVSVRDVSGRAASATAHALLASEPSDLDRTPGSAPLRVERAGATGPPAGAAGLRVTWEVTGAAASLYRGTLRSLIGDRAYDHAGMGACGIVGGETAVPLPAEDSYYLVTGTCAWGDTPPGRDSLGRPRPGAIDRCP